MSNFVMNAEVRSDLGKGSSRRLRRFEDKTPAVVYGADKKPQSISLLHKDLIKITEDEAFYSSILTLNIGDNSEKVLVKDMQRHPAKAIIMHIDFLRIDDNHAVIMSIPLHFINEAECYGVKTEGGRISHNLKVLEISCLPKDLPKYIEVDLENIKQGEIVHISDIKLPEGTEATALRYGPDHDLSVVSVVAIKGSVDDEDSPAAAADEEGEAEASTD